jgi:hypothetical protein
VRFNTVYFLKALRKQLKSPKIPGFKDLENEHKQLLKECYEKTIKEVKENDETAASILDSHEIYLRWLVRQKVIAAKNKSQRERKSPLLDGSEITLFRRTTTDFA